MKLGGIEVTEAGGWGAAIGLLTLWFLRGFQVGRRVGELESTLARTCAAVEKMTDQGREDRQQLHKRIDEVHERMNQLLLHLQRQGPGVPGLRERS